MVMTDCLLIKPDGQTSKVQIAQGQQDYCLNEQEQNKICQITLCPYTIKTNIFIETRVWQVALFDHSKIYTADEIKDLVESLDIEPISCHHATLNR